MLTMSFRQRCRWSQTCQDGITPIYLACVEPVVTTGHPPTAYADGARTVGLSRIGGPFRAMIWRRVTRLSATGGLRSTMSGWSPLMSPRTDGRHHISIV